MAHKTTTTRHGFAGRAVRIESRGPMSFEYPIVGILVLAIGIALCFAGYRAFRALIAVWGFFAAFLLIVQAVRVYSGDHFLVSVGGLVIAFMVGLVLAALVYYLYVAAVVILSASVGFWVGIKLMMVIGYSSHSTPVLLAGVIFAGIMAILTLVLNLTKILIIISTSLGGASTIIAGVLLLLRVIPLESLSLGIIGAII